MDRDPSISPQWQAELDRQHGKFGSPNGMLHYNPYPPPAPQPLPPIVAAAPPPPPPETPYHVEAPAESVIYAPSASASYSESSSSGSSTSSFGSLVVIGAMILGGVYYWQSHKPTPNVRPVAPVAFHPVGRLHKPAALTFKARRVGRLGSGCDGELKFADQQIVFDCPDRYTLQIPRVGTAGDENGVRTAEGVTYHFAIADKTDAEIQALFDNWVLGK